MRRRYLSFAAAALLAVIIAGLVVQRYRAAALQTLIAHHRAALLAIGPDQKGTVDVTPALHAAEDERLVGSELGRRMLFELLLERKLHPGARLNLIIWLADRRTPGLDAVLIDFYEPGGPYHDKLASLDGLSRYSDPEVVEHLLRVVRTEENPTLRSSAAYALADSVPADRVDELIERFEAEQEPLTDRCLTLPSPRLCRRHTA